MSDHALVIIVILFIVFGGGGFAWSRRRSVVADDGEPAAFGFGMIYNLLGLILTIAIIAWILRLLGIY